MQKILTGVVLIWLTTMMAFAASQGTNIRDIAGLGTGVKAALAVAKNTAGGPVVSDSNNQIPGSGVAGMLQITCTTPAANDTYIYNGTGMSCVHHVTSQNYTTAHTVNASDVNAASPCTLTAASDVVITFDTDANVPTNEGDSVCFAQSSTGSAIASAVSGTVTINAESSKKSTNGLYAGWCAVKSATANVWRLFGNRK